MFKTVGVCEQVGGLETVTAHLQAGEAQGGCITPIHQRADKGPPY